jgi:hypothetical protein
MLLEKTQDDLRSADQFIRCIHFLTRKSGHTTALKYAMHEDYSVHTQAMNVSNSGEFRQLRVRYSN